MGLKIGKALKGINKAINKVGSVASKVVSNAANVVSKVGNIPGVNMIPGVGTITNIAKTAGNIAKGVGGVIKSGQSPRGSSAPAMAPPPQEFAPQSAQAAWDVGINVGGVNASVSGGGSKGQQQNEKQSWFKKNKIVVFISSGIALLVGLLAFVFRKKGGRRRR